MSKTAEEIIERIEKDAEGYAFTCDLGGDDSVTAVISFREGAISERNKAIEEIQMKFQNELMIIDPLSQNILQIAKAVSEIYKSLETMKVISPTGK